jgi:leucyl aminopeptidase
MKVAVTTIPVSQVEADLIGMIVFEDDLTGHADLFSAPFAPFAQFPAPVVESLQQAFKDERFRARVGQSLVVHTQGRLAVRRVAVVGAGALANFRTADARHGAAVLARIANTVGARSLVVSDAAHERGGSLPPDAARWIEAVAEGVLLGAYRFDRYLAPEKRSPATLETTFLRTSSDLPREVATAAVARGQRVADAVAHARDLVNEPAGALTPTAIAADTGDRGAPIGLAVTVLGPEECRARGMGLFLAVAQGSNQEPRFVHSCWRPAVAKKRVVLIGKGVTFDSGGLSLKTTEGMLEMKSDMAGAAAVLSAIAVAAQEKLSVEVHAIAACTENMPSGTAYKLGDVLRSMSGKTVEITNTDAEGRLTLADALTYALALDPDVVLDLATLTGACIVALGPHAAGVMTNDDASAAVWLAAARDAGEDMWPLPLPARLVDQLKSEIADLRNSGERWGGALIAGLFLKEFVGNTPWIHVDIAGPATTNKEWGCYGKGATGFGVASIVQYLRNLAST